MNSVPSHSGTGEHTVVITRVAERQWHALEDDRVVGRGEAWRRLDGRLFASIDSWHGAVFDQLADVMLAGLPRPLYTMADEADVDLTSHWERVGFTARHREWVCLVPTDPRATGLDSAQPPSGVTIVPLGEAEEGPLRQLDRTIRDEVEASVGWQEMPAEVLRRPDDAAPVDPSKLVDPSKYAVAALADHYVGLIRVAPVPRQPRLGLVAVRADQHRRGIAHAMLAQVLGSLHQSGIQTVSAEVSESNEAALALFDGIGAQRVNSNLELVLR
ncbi:N-acetyltransferase [Streptomyces pluripotens]|uniref:N-acetyltransferase n=1 Tax=Streptomyces pluripotens TaxID=1355015 RepID=A0A221NXI4_9ACTN|nr:MULTISPECIES: GNAT family N-acetyltransferase [Streptomyces]ARP70279.1 GNAT family N-acetyltransferase [Streptomyces pluripotens]ASN24536.1 N-acetyltransferase [Streptomyces pluripotens]KIE28058.1 GCN5 family acetyltransferase [Streptomyces sp. MUSC 125]MCH0558380.1 GNAT family N-acetyltransferase [Streptomyces sp. MUM 16J]